METKIFEFDQVKLVFALADGVATFTAVPHNMADKIVAEKMDGHGARGNRRMESAMQVAIEDNDYSRQFTAGKTHRNKMASAKMGIPTFDYSVRGNCITLTVSYMGENGLAACQIFEQTGGGSCVSSYCKVQNKGKEPLVLECVPSFNITRLSPFVHYNDHSNIMIHTLKSHWSGEGKLYSASPAHYGLEESWCGDGIRVEKIGQLGSMPANGYLPWVAIEDRTAECAWAVQFETPSSWQIEIANVNNGLSIAGGQADFTFGHWKKALEENEVFTTHKAYLSVVCGNMEKAAQDIVHYLERFAVVPPSEQELPIIYNEYCHSWGKPSMESVKKILPASKAAGCEYFVVDAGWYCPDGKMWWSLGDWETNTRLFPKGLKGYADECKKNNMRAGIWFEFESFSDDSDIAAQHPEWLLKCNNKIINHGGRCMPDMRNPQVRDYLSQKVIDLLLWSGIRYIKVDYNETIGLGVDGAYSLGEGLREQIEASMLFYQKMKDAVPDLVVEICSSGGMRHEPKWISVGSMSSFSDAHEGAEGAVIACNLHRFMSPRKLQIWAVIRQDYSKDDVYFTMAKSMLGRICLSGDLSAVSADVLSVVHEGTSFYNKIKDVLKNGETIKIQSEDISYLREIHGTQVLQRVSTCGKKLLWYGFSMGKPGAEIKDTIFKGYSLKDSYGNFNVNYLDGNITATAADANMAGCVLLFEKA